MKTLEGRDLFRYQYHQYMHFKMPEYLLYMCMKSHMKVHNVLDIRNNTTERCVQRSWKDCSPVSPNLPPEPRQSNVTELLGKDTVVLRIYEPCELAENMGRVNKSNLQPLELISRPLH